MMIFWSILLIVVLVMLLRLVPAIRSEIGVVETPLEQLKYRYAAGELTTDEYEERRSRLHRQ